MKYVASRVTRALLAAVVITVAPSVALASSIPPIEVAVFAAPTIPILTLGTVTGSACTTGPTGGCESSTATASYTGFDAMVSGRGSTIGGSGTANTAGSAVVTFFFQVEGSAPGVTTVPLIFTGSDSTSASGPSAAAYGYFQTPGGQVDSCSAAGSQVGTCGTLPSSNSGTLHYNATPMLLYDVEVTASGSASLGTGSWSASVDPKVEIDPNFAYASDFSLVFSPAPTPEPGSLALLGSGVLGLGAWLRRSLRK
jgi:hypothetical protein